MSEPRPSVVRVSSREEFGRPLVLGGKTGPRELAKGLGQPRTEPTPVRFPEPGKRTT